MSQAKPETNGNGSNQSISFVTDYQSKGDSTCGRLPKPTNPNNSDYIESHVKSKAEKFLESRSTIPSLQTQKTPLRETRDYSPQAQENDLNEAEGLGLDLIKNNSNFYDCHKIYMRGVDHKENRYREFILPCNQWKCPTCRKRKIKKLRKEVKRGILNVLDEENRKGFNMQYSVKMLTLTWPGKDRRSSDSSLGFHPDYTGTDTIEDAHKEIKKMFNKLKTAMFKKIGRFHYFMVVEPQEDGYPHLHVVLLGKSIAYRQIKTEIERLWRDKYGMGFIKIKVAKYGYRGAVNYVTKYLTKMPYGLPKGVRFHSNSKGMREVKKRDKHRYTWVEYGFVDKDYDNHIVSYRAIWEVNGEAMDACNISDYCEEGVICPEQLMKNLNELVEFFEDKRKPYQMTLEGFEKEVLCLSM